MSKHVRGICMSDMGPSLVAVGYEKTDGRKPLYTTDHAEELAKALEATNNELTFAMQLYKQDDEDWQKIMRMIVANASIISNYREATK